MRQEIQLYLNGQQLDLNDNGGIYFNYRQKDVKNPTAVKNAFSKTLTVPGTDNNNQIFNNIWNLNRAQTTDIVPYFNQSKRVPFELFLNGELIEQGYAKMDAIHRDKVPSYDLTLYGGLGDFFYSLSYNGETGEKRTLADLDFGFSSIIMNKETIKKAWDDVRDGTSSAVTFVPCYNGVPDKLDAEKVLVNTSGFTGHMMMNSGSGYWGEITGFPDNLQGYSTYNGYGLVQLPEPMTEWKMRDLRSYLQRPALRVKDFISACTRPESNGGYEVELDDDFFNTDNPYYEEAWITLPTVPELDASVGADSISAITITINNTSGNTAVGGLISFSINQETGYTNTIKMNLRMTSELTSNYAYTSAFAVTPSPRRYTALGGIGVQIVGQNTGGTRVQDVAASNVCWLTTRLVAGNGQLMYTFQEAVTDNENPFKDYATVDTYIGKFNRVSGGIYEWEEPITLNIGSNVNINQYKIKICCLQKKVLSPWNFTGFMWPNTNMDGLSGGKIMSVTTPTIVAATTKLSPETSSYSNVEVSKEQLLNTQYTPADYLLSYCKLFNLYFDRDVHSKKISILTPKNFYDRDVNISDDIDRNMDIKPLSFDHKWYSLSYRNNQTTTLNAYKTKYGTEFGQQRINTGYEFDAETEELMKGNVFLNASQVLEASKYYRKMDNNSCDSPAFLLDNVTYSLFNTEFDTIDVELGKATGTSENDINAKSTEFIKYDNFSKVQVHNEEKPIDGANILVFYNGQRPTAAPYWVTDDVYPMLQVNDNPCWLYTVSEYDVNGNKIAIKVNELPQFSRYIANDNNIFASWDFGRTKELYVPEIKYIDGDATLYERYWKMYINDIYDVDTRIVTGYIKFDEKPTKESLKHFYFFEDCYWVIDEIIDYNPTSYGLTKVKFVKVNDKDNYLNNNIIPPEPPTPEPDTITITAPTPIAATATSLGYTVTASDNCKVQIIGRTNRNGHTSGTTTSSLPIPANESSSYKYYTVEAWLTMNPSVSAYTIVQQLSAGTPHDVSITAATPIDATATTLYYTVTADDAVTVTLDSSAIPQPITNTHQAGTTNGSFTIPVNEHSYVEYWGLYAKLVNYPSVTAYTSVEQMGTQTPIYTNIPMTFEVSTAGTINWKHNRTLTGDIGNLTIQYRINGGTWTNLTSSTAGTTFSVAAGDIVEFRGDNSRYSSLPLSYTTFSGSTAGFEAYGNIMSLISSTGYETATTLSQQYCFNRLFAGTKITNAENLVLPATTLPMHVYTSMFQGCTLMTKAPSLPAPTLTNSCYNEMFNGCSSLSYIRCLATDISAYNCTYNWVANVANTGTFVKAPTMTAWTLNSDNGVPVNWTLVDDLGTLTGITLDNLEWYTDVPATGGTATYQNCTYTVTGHYDNGATSDLTSVAIMTGSTTLTVPATQSTTRQNVGTISINAEYYDGPNPFTAGGAVYVYQAPYVSPVSDKYVTLHLVYTGSTTSSFPVITAAVANVAPQTWTPSYLGETYDMVFSAGQVTDSAIMVTAVDQVPPYLDNLSGLLQGGSLSDTQYGTGQAGITMQLNFSFGQSTIAQFYCDIAGYDN